MFFRTSGYRDKEALSRRRSDRMRLRLFLLVQAECEQAPILSSLAITRATRYSRKQLAEIAQMVEQLHGKE